MIIVLLAVFGLCLGSFVNALVWRLHEQGAGRAKAKRVKRDDRLSILHGRSMCPDCHHQLAAKDLVPVFSWLALRGKCRYCGKPISWQYPLVELLTAALFILSYIYWPNGFHGAGLLEFVLWLVYLTGLMALIIYDLRWFILPNRIIYPLFWILVVQILIVGIFFGGGVNEIVGAVYGALVIGGLFFVLFYVSNGRWIGGGDVRLGALLGLLVGGPSMAILLLFLASAGGSIIALPLLATGKVKRTTRLPFGPFLCLAAIIVELFGASIINWYKHRLLLI